ncbi:exodeoxyribonuclease VII small subunit [Verrucomicrobium spinosum]|uniref:exodeoxyribonuclease VII small subunit n=1 Tax=Verrucomicrobium spinosum TaxID=2736 RepID=UPI000946154F|nr:exodeoxyribonuclease VII small subunit [Verrucomicrobium spinosum]
MTEEERLPEDLSFEEAMESLEAIVSSLESERMPLEEMVQSYERGARLLSQCRSRIESARQRVEMITADLDGRGRVSLSDFAAMEETATPQLLATQPQKRAPSPVSHEKTGPRRVERR